MGLTTIRLTVRKQRESRRAREVEFLVDSGASYTVVDARILRALGVKPHRSEDFYLADGSRITRRMGDAYFELGRRGASSPVIFGQRGDEALLGAITLEALGLMLDPLKRELRKMKLMLATAAGRPTRQHPEGH
jgi:predicted aspartyl protease